MPSGFDSTFGAFEIGVIISSVLFGFTALQTYMYFSRFPDNRRPMKCLVAFVWCCEMAHVVCVGAALYTMTITYFGQPERLVRTPNSLTGGVTFSAFVGPSLSFIRLVGTLVEGLKMVTILEFEKQWGWLVVSAWGIGAATDLIIARTLAYLLSRQRSELLPKRTLKVVDKLIVWTIETGAITSFAGVATLICAMRQFFWAQY
ncbi:hypothetical protein FB451DRAFT_202108 [Mycena latifolia]|nr:hypothetical protein FB451DRAFT_202108 [Mycena latifolia]